MGVLQGAHQLLASQLPVQARKRHCGAGRARLCRRLGQRLQVPGRHHALLHGAGHGQQPLPVMQPSAEQHGRRAGWGCRRWLSSLLAGQPAVVATFWGCSGGGGCCAWCRPWGSELRQQRTHRFGRHASWHVFLCVVVGRLPRPEASEQQATPHLVLFPGTLISPLGRLWVAVGPDGVASTRHKSLALCVAVAVALAPSQNGAAGVPSCACQCLAQLCAAHRPHVPCPMPS